MEKKPSKKPTKKRVTKKEATPERGWMIRFTDGQERSVSTHEKAKGFTWNPVGEWAEAPDWRSRATCGNGLHGQSPQAGGATYSGGSYPELLETEGPQISIGTDKVKVRRAKRVSIGDLSKMPEEWKTSLSFPFATHLTALPNRLVVKKDLRINGCHGLKKLPDSLEVGREFHLAACDHIDRLSRSSFSCARLDLTNMPQITEVHRPTKCMHVGISRCRVLFAVYTGKKPMDYLGLCGLQALFHIETPPTVRRFGLERCDAVSELGSFSGGREKWSYFYVHHCGDLETIENLRYRRVSLMECNRLYRVGKITAADQVAFEYCRGLEKVGDVKAQELIVRHAVSLETVADSLDVDVLSLISCRNLKRLVPSGKKCRIGTLRIIGEHQLPKTLLDDMNVEVFI